MHVRHLIVITLSADYSGVSARRQACPVKMDSTHIWTLLLLSVTCFNMDRTSVVSGLFCTDPDTGEFHSVNTTWSAKTFCGNYTCKQRRKNSTLVNTTTEVVSTLSASDVHEQLIAATNNNIVINKHLHRETGLKQNAPTKVVKNDPDRFLTDEEIKTITDLLHSVKKSDLDSIVEIYNLAQDIYRELDVAASENMLDRATNHIRNKMPKFYTARKEDKRPHYPTHWFDPLHNSYHIIPNTLPPATPAIQILPPPIPAPSQIVPEYKSITNTFPVYPISSFQKLSSYLQYPQRAQIHTNKPRCNNIVVTPNPVQTITPWVNRIVKKPFLVDPSENVGLLPYPFSNIHHYNYTSNPNKMYFDTNYWSTLNTLQHSPMFVSPQMKRTSKIYDQKIPPVHHTNEKPIVVENNDAERARLLHALMKEPLTPQIEVAKKETWKTDPLSSKVLEEMTANILDRSDKLSKTNLVKRKVRFERIGKILRLDDLSRRKRDVDKDDRDEESVIVAQSPDDDLYEVYLDTIVCATSTELGFFQFGNTTASFPDCCPKKILKIIE